MHADTHLPSTCTDVHAHRFTHTSTHTNTHTDPDPVTHPGRTQPDSLTHRLIHTPTQTHPHKHTHKLIHSPTKTHADPLTHRLTHADTAGRCTQTHVDTAYAQSHRRACTHIHTHQHPHRHRDSCTQTRTDPRCRRSWLQCGARPDPGRFCSRLALGACE